ncbi:MAG: hypothetical protein Q8874_02785, partial [Sweet potato little leaf phytoplasma]|nr:hypothetical protein [Sweet potato little leaf phytoplasma]
MQASFYNQGYGTNESVSLTGSGTHRLSEYTTLTSSLGYVNTIVGAFNGGAFSNLAVPTVSTPVAGTRLVGGTGGSAVGVVAPPVVGALPGGVLTPGVGLGGFSPNPVLGGIGQRQQAYQISGGISTMLTPRDQVNVGITGSAQRLGNARRFGGVGFNDFNQATPNIAYSRIIDERTRIGASFAVGFTDYLGTRIGDATIYQPSLTGSRVLSDRWTLSGAIGVAIVSADEPGGGSSSST